MSGHEIENIKKENKLLRKYAWLNHGCQIGSLYGDDGEMQCNACMIDFKNEPVSVIIEKILKKNMKLYEEDLEISKNLIMAIKK